MSRSLFAVAVAALMLGATVGSVAAESVDLSGVVVIVNASQGVTTISTAELTKLFLKKSTKWENGTAVVPVDQAPNALPRCTFTDKVLGKTPSAVNSYWQQQVFSGAGVPPEILAGDETVVAFVKQNVGAVGYVSAEAKLDGVKALTVTQ